MASIDTGLFLLLFSSQAFSYRKVNFTYRTYSKINSGVGGLGWSSGPRNVCFIVILIE